MKNQQEKPNFNEAKPQSYATQPRFIHIGNNYIVNLDELEQYHCKQGRICPNYLAKMSKESWSFSKILGSSAMKSVSSNDDAKSSSI